MMSTRSKDAEYDDNEAQERFELRYEVRR